MYFLFLIFAFSSGYDGCPLDRLVSSYGLEWLRWFALMCFLLFALSAAGSDRMFEQLQILNQPPLTQIDCTNQINLILQGSPTTFFIQNHTMLRYLVFPTKFQLSKFHMEKCEKMKSLVKNTDHQKWIILLSSAWYGCHKSLPPISKTSTHVLKLQTTEKEKTKI